MLPNESTDDFYVHCSGWSIEKHAFCGVNASYPPDPNIRLYARVYTATKPPNDFRAIARRMREIAYCLDVTDQLLPDGSSPNSLVDPTSELPTLTKCVEFIS